MGRPRENTQRRAQLVESALDVIQDRGIGNMRIQDVALRAGVSTGTVHYHFTDIDQLIYDVHTWACERFFTKRLTALTDVSDAREQLSGLIDSGLPESQDDPVVVAMYEIDLYRRGDRSHALLGQALYDRQVTLYFSALQLGVGQQQFALNAPILDIAQNLVALEDAYGMHIIYGNRSTSIDRSHDLILEYARTATSCDSIGELRRTGRSARDGTAENEVSDHRP